ncbi:FAD-binding domain-containing protein [Microthyrium microscopicum]|uniref:FAD-binding domain-containing protein n=1 Tax=Microthyrium microscopicum TaxID=703497 RepID=A0A6A6U8B9_9PEZI|nr:FAD-binding domain-containing protein [Microthyrium microscopicum]
MSSCTEEGIVIALRPHMTSVNVDPTAKTITAGGGALWKDVDEAAGKYGLATTGGAVNHTGIGGLTLGGGYGYLTGRHGLVVDNLLSATVVLADGRIVQTSKDSVPDLFWAIRGAGQSFGVVTEFVYQAHEQGEVFAGQAIFPFEKLDSILDFVHWFHNHGDGDQSLTWAFIAPPPHNVPVVFCILFYNGPEDKARAFFKPLLDIGPVMQNVGMMPYDNINGLMNEQQDYGARRLFGGSNFVLPVDKTTVHDVADEFFKVVNDEGINDGTLIMFETIPYRKVKETPNTAMAFGNRGEFYIAGLLWKWRDAARDAQVRQHNRNIQDLIKEKMGTKDIQAVGHYSNYASGGEKTEALFGQNTARLRELKAKYDPNNRFNKWHNLMSS